jgi:2',3'-cyclic-nucleotide 2'-phosphodiesterase (5'-nucleotidase family)
MRFSHFRYIVAVAAVAACLPWAGRLSAAEFTLQLLHASDLEGGVDSIVNAPNFAAVVEGLESAAATAGTPSILLCAGDSYIPGPFFSAAADGALRTPLRAALGNPLAREGLGRVDIGIMNVLGFDASCLGNHEFDPGTTVVREIFLPDIRDANSDGTLDEARWLGPQFPYLSANLDFSGDANLASLYTSAIEPNTSFIAPLSDLVLARATKKLASATIVTRGTEQIGVVGGTTPLLARRSSPGATVVKGPGAGTNSMSDLASILQPVIDQVVALGVNKVILATHLQQLALEQELIGLLHGVDIVIAGGSDTILADGTDVLRGGDVAAGTYPYVTTNADGEPAVVVSTDGQYRYVGRLVVTFDESGVIDPASIVPEESGAWATMDDVVEALWPSIADAFVAGTKASRVKTLTDGVQGVVIAKDTLILGKTSVFLEGRRALARTEETNLGNLSAEANLAAGLAVDPTAVVSIKNGGGIRAPIGFVDGYTGELLPPLANPLSGKLAGEISRLDVEDSLRFNNLLSLQTVTAEQLAAILEHGVAATGPGATPGQFPQIAGVSFSFDPSLSAGGRVRDAIVETAGGPDVLLYAGELVGDPERPFRVVTLNFMADGGDGYPFKTFHDADPAFANRIDLNTLGLPPGGATFAVPGSEQDAMAEYLLANFQSAPYDTTDTPIEEDARIQNLSVRGDSVIPGPRFRRGDSNGSGGDLDLSDGIDTLRYLFLGDTDLSCPSAADVNDSGEVDVADPLYVFGYLFLGGMPPARPFPACGPDLSSDSLPCETQNVCE